MELHLEKVSDKIFKITFKKLHNLKCVVSLHLLRKALIDFSYWEDNYLLRFNPGKSVIYRAKTTMPIAGVVVFLWDINNIYLC